MDRDGDLDLLVVRYDQATQRNVMATQVNDGTGRFNAVFHNLLAAKMYPVDLDGDGDVDVIDFRRPSLGAPMRIAVYENDGQGNFTDASASWLQGDFRSLEIVAVDLWSGPGAAFLLRRASDQELRMLYTNVARRRMYFSLNDLNRDVGASPVLCDIDGDGWRDIVSPGLDYVLRGRRYHAFSYHVPGPEWPWPHFLKFSEAVDLDGDGRPELLGSGGYLRLNDGGFVLREGMRTPHPWNASPPDLVADFDGDGTLDILHHSPFVHVAFMDPSIGRYELVSSNVATTSHYNARAALDADGDGDLDIAVGMGEFLLNTDGRHFVDASAGRMPGQPGDPVSALRSADVDSDGDMDLVVAGEYMQRDITVLRNDGRGVFTRGPSILNTDRCNNFELADLDGDGDIDIMDACRRAFANDGSGNFSDVSAQWLGATGWFPVRGRIHLVDFDADGDVDLIGPFSPRTNGPVHRNDGSGRLTPVAASAALRSITHPEGVEVADFDLDGHLDLLVQARFNQEHRGVVLRGDGRGNFTGPMLGPPLQYTVDLDGDGDPDGFELPDGRIWKNSLHELMAPYRARLGRPWELEIYAAARPANSPAAVGALLLGTAPARVNVPGLGTLRLAPSAIVGAVTTTIPAQRGVASVGLQIPGDPVLEGTRLYAQAVIFDPLRHRPALTAVASDLIH